MENQLTNQPQPVVSVLVITYKHEAYIGECLDSVLAQQCDFPIEIIVGEDCSPDRTREIVLDYQRDHADLIRVVFSDKNVGLIQNVHRCEDIAKGKYIAYLGGDDVWHDPLKLQKQVNFLESHPDHAIVHTDYARKMGEWTVRDWNGRNGKEMAQGDVWPAMLHNNFLCASTVLIRGNLISDFRKTPYASRDYAMEDYPRWLFACRRGHVGYINESTTTYRVVAGAMTQGSPEKMIRFWKSYRQIARDFAADFNADNALTHAMECYHNDYMLNYAIRAGDHALFNEEFRWMKMNNAVWYNNPRNRIYSMLFRLGLTPLLKLHARIGAIRLKRFYQRNSRAE